MPVAQTSLDIWIVYQNKIMKIMFPENPKEPCGKEFCSPNIQGTKQMIPHFPTNPGEVKSVGNWKVFIYSTHHHMPYK